MLNKVQIIGNLGKDAEIRSFQNGDKVAAFSLATTNKWKDKSGEWKEATEWHRVSVLNQNLVPVIEKYAKKGAKVYVEGQLENRKWTDKDGKEHISTEVMIRPYRGEVQFLDKKEVSDEPF